MLSKLILFLELQASTPPLDKEILLLTKAGQWFVGSCQPWNEGQQQGIQFADGSGWKHEFSVGHDRWMLLPQDLSEENIEKGRGG